MCQRPCSRIGFRGTALLNFTPLSATVLHSTSLACPSTPQYTTPRQALHCHDAQQCLALKYSSVKNLPMFNTTSVPLRLDLLHLATGSTSLKVQPHGTDFPSLNSAAGGTQGVEERLLRHKWSKGEHSRGTETAGKWHQ